MFRFCYETFPGFLMKNQTDPNPLAKDMKSSWRKQELTLLILYAVLFYAVIIRRSLQISHDYYHKVLGLRPGWAQCMLSLHQLIRQYIYFIFGNWEKSPGNDPFSGNMIAK
ncbi:hypothetical protein AAG906_021354 [Vitis piasezkii]